MAVRIDCALMGRTVRRRGFGSSGRLVVLLCRMVLRRLVRLPRRDIRSRGRR